MGPPRPHAARRIPRSPPHLPPRPRRPVIPFVGRAIDFRRLPPSEARPPHSKRAQLALLTPARRSRASLLLTGPPQLLLEHPQRHRPHHDLPVDPLRRRLPHHERRRPRRPDLHRLRHVVHHVLLVLLARHARPERGRVHLQIRREPHQVLQIELVRIRAHDVPELP